MSRQITRAERKLRAALATTVEAGQAICPRCDQPIHPDQRWHAGHRIDAALGGTSADGLRAEHEHCNTSAGAHLGNQLRAQRGDFRGISRGNSRRNFSRGEPITDSAVGFLQPASRPGSPAPLSASPPESADPAPASPGPTDPLWDRCTWLDQLRNVPAGATWPRYMTGPHPDAVGSYGAEATAWLAATIGLRLRWWQQLTITRELEHDAEGNLVWLELLVSTSRQVGKSTGIRGQATWRLHQADRFGEEQLILHTGKDLPVCKEVQRPARIWARERAADGYGAREQNGTEEVSAPDGSRWLVRGKDSVYSYAATFAITDEAWKVPPGVVTDGLEPTLAERCSPQSLLTSTAHRKATPLFPNRRAVALGSLDAPGSTLLLEWSAPHGADIADRTAWRAASPHWSAGRERLIAAALERALRGESDDPDEDDPIASFTTQWLNIWPAVRRPLRRLRDELLLDAGVWQAAADATIPVPAGPLILAVEDWFGRGAAAAAAAVLEGGRVLVWGELFPDRAAACGWCAQLAGEHPNSRLLAGVSLVGDPAVTGVGVPVEPFGTQQTGRGLPALRQLVKGGLVHDGGSELAGQMERLRVVEGPSGLRVSPGSPRSDLARCALWAVTEAVKAPAGVEESRIY